MIGGGFRGDGVVTESSPYEDLVTGETGWQIGILWNVVALWPDAEVYAICANV